MRTREELKEMRDKAAAEIEQIDGNLARAEQSRDLAGTVPGGIGDANLDRMRQRRMRLVKRIADAERSMA